MTKHINIKVYGQVQGVGFRYGAKELADSLGLAGFIRNVPNGSLYLEVEGEEEPLNKFVSWCQNGPATAQVDKVDVSSGEMKDFSSFLILSFTPRS